MDNDKANKISNKIGAGIAILVALTVFLSLIGGVSVKNMITGVVVAVSFLFFLLGGVFGQKFKLYKEAYHYTFIALVTLMAANLLEIYL